MTKRQAHIRWLGELNRTFGAWLRMTRDTSDGVADAELVLHAEHVQAAMTARLKAFGSDGLKELKR
jgi:hypothetical protein